MPDGTEFTGGVRYITRIDVPTLNSYPDPVASPICLSATQSDGTTQFAYGIRPYSEETAPLQTNALRIDGEAMYSQARGGIYAEGYMDLQGPAPEDDRALDVGECAIGNGWTKVGDDVTDPTTLAAINAVHSGPAYEQAEVASPILKSGSNLNNKTPCSCRTGSGGSTNFVS